MSRFTLSDIETLCGVTLDAVKECSRESHVTGLEGPGEEFVIIPRDTVPALAGATARYLIGSSEFSHIASGGYPIYRKAAQ